MNDIKNLKIRPYKKEDINEVLNIVQYHIKNTFKNKFSEPIIKFISEYHSLESILKDSKKGIIICAELDNKIIGTVTLINNYINRLYVSYKYQNMGIGTFLMKNIEKIAFENGNNMVELDCYIFSMMFYVKLGYKVVEKKSDYVNGDYLYYFKMEKKLSAN
jgi:GNAT superfamily N-acetyltransferase